MAQMRQRYAASVLALPLLLVVSGCGYVHIGKLPPPPPATVMGDDQLLKQNSDLRLEKKMLQQELALSRAQGQALRQAIENRAADGDTSKRVAERLSDTARELAALRDSYAKLQVERDRAVANAGDVNLQTKLAATEEKLADSLHAYTELKAEVAKLRDDVTQSRQENLALTSQLKAANTQNAQAQAALAALNTDLMTQKEARQRAEQDAATLRAEIRTGAASGSSLAQMRTGAAAEARSMSPDAAAENAALQKQLGALREKVSSLESERAQLRQQLAAAEAATKNADVANMQAKLADALDQLKSTKTELASVTAAKADLATQLAQLKSGPAGTEAQSLRDQLRQTQAQATALAEENARLKTRLVSATTPGVAPSGSGANGTQDHGTPISAVNATFVASPPAGVTPANTTIVAKANNVRIDLGGTTRFHVVAGGDTLAKISQQYYGTTSRWGDILAANRDVLGENNNLVIGRTLRIP